MGPPISVVVERGGVAESRHRVHAVAVHDRKVVDAAGDPGLVTFLRSGAKPLQATLVAREEPSLTEAELAIAAASHEATSEQLAAVRALLERSGSTEAELACGEERGAKIAHNCSGKHAGMLLVVKRRGWPVHGYPLPGHPLQEELGALVAAAAGIRRADVPTAVDGCGVVTFALSLRAMAQGFARLACGEPEGAERVVAAMRARPELVGGPSAADTALMGALPGAAVKRGAEGLLCAALPDGRGVAVKVEDGGNRAAGPATARFLGVETLLEVPILNSLGGRVGRLFAAS